jgi:GT2 family glycosyltransferase
METHIPYFSIVILCWNNNSTITKCLDCLSVQTNQDFEILLVDNGSFEPIRADLVDRYPQLLIKLSRHPENIGFATANNLASRFANGKYLVLLNADAFPVSDWLENIQRGIDKYPNSFFASKLIRADQPDRLDGTGDIFHVSGLAWRQLNNKLVAGAADLEAEVFSACGAAAVYPKEAFERVNGFDEDYFSYAEDVDLSFRLRLIGYRCIYLPSAVVYHTGSASTKRRSDFSVYYGQRNLTWTFLKDIPGAYVWLLAPFHFIASLMMIGLGIVRGQARITVKAKLDALRSFTTVIKKRRQVQNSRVVPALQIMTALDWNPFSPIIKLMHN